MTAHLYCWHPSLGLTPASASFVEQVTALHEAPAPTPSPALLSFVESLLAEYPDLTETDDTVWGDGPLENNIIGNFINMSLIWSRYEEAAPFVIATAHDHGLHCYDPQSDEFYPVQGD